MRRVRTCVLAVAAWTGLGLVGPSATALGHDPDPAQVRAVAAIMKVGGWVSPGTLLLPPGLVVVMEGEKVSDGDLAHLGAFDKINVLSLDRARISDAGLVQLKGLKALRSLTLENTAVTDTGLADLVPLKSLRELDLKGTQITDAGVEHLKQMRRLRKLTVSETGITAEGIRALRPSLPLCRIR